MSDSSIFFNEPTVIDHSFIAGDGGCYGGSVNPSFYVTGAVSEQENVVLDFSSGKKRIKEWIDDNDNGFDHKCWIVRGVSNFDSVYAVEDRMRVDDWDYLASAQDPDRVLTVSTRRLIITAPKSAFRFMLNDAKFAEVYKAAETEMRLWLEAKMSEFTFDVKMCANAVPSTIKPYQLFRYVHGLKKSTSWGCQNIAHGHLSYIDCDTPKEVDPEFKEQILKSIAKTLDNTIFISAENYSKNEYFHTISYTSQTRGDFTMELPVQRPFHKFVVFETETTIEHIIEYVAALFKPQLKSLKATRLFVSEGLSKGALMNLNFEEQE